MLTLIFVATLLQAQPAPKPPAAPGQPRVVTEPPKQVEPKLQPKAQITTQPPPADLPSPKPIGKAVATVVAAADLTPVDTPVAIGWCGNEFTKYWEDAAPESLWYLVKIDGVQAPWGGLLTKGSDGCYSTEKKYSFAAGDHNVVVSLVLPQGREVNTTPPNGPAGGAQCVAGTDCYGAESAVLLVKAANEPPPPTPVNCVVSDFGAWSEWSEWLQVSPTEDQRKRTRTRTVTTPAANGGTECPPLSETETETRPHVELPPPPEDVCQTTPLKVTVNKWPAGQDGTRNAQWNSGAFKLTSVKFEWSPRLVFTATDSRGCTVVVNK